MVPRVWVHPDGTVRPLSLISTQQRLLHFFVTDSLRAGLKKKLSDFSRL
jgi:hypothetical protein